MYKPEEKQECKRGINFFEALTILFIALKLTGYIDWWWGWVLAPIIMEWANKIFIAVIAATLISITEVLKEYNRKKNIEKKGG